MSKQTTKAPQVKPPSDDDLAGLLAGNPPRQTPGTTIRDRRQPAKKRPLSPRDGRYRRSTGRNRSVTFQIREEVFEAAAELAADINVPKVELYEVAIQYLVEQIREGKISFDDIAPQN